MSHTDKPIWLITNKWFVNATNELWHHNCIAWKNGLFILRFDKDYISYKD